MARPELTAEASPDPEGEAMSRCIVCGVEDATRSRHAASIAARLARDLDSRAVLVHVIGAGGALSRLRFRRRRQKRRGLKAVADEHCFPRATDLRVTSGDPASTLVAVADDAELIVVGAGGEAMSSANLLGSVTSTLMHRAPCPVVVVPSHAVAPLDAEGMRSVVCGIAGDETDAALLHLAGDFASRLRGELHVVHAYDPTPAHDDVRESALRESAEHRLAVALEEAGVDAQGSVVPLLPADALEHVAEQQSAGLIVVGAKGAGRGPSFVHGSVPTRLAAQGRTAVAVLPLAVRLEPGSGHYELVVAAV
jgi:nucleotide-binding universal stress UspA family protein